MSPDLYILQLAEVTIKFTGRIRDLRRHDQTPPLSTPSTSHGCPTAVACTYLVQCRQWYAVIQAGKVQQKVGGPAYGQGLNSLCRSSYTSMGPLHLLVFMSCSPRAPLLFSVAYIQLPHTGETSIFELLMAGYGTCRLCGRCRQPSCISNPIKHLHEFLLPVQHLQSRDHSLD
jgi:hypothetical protein